MEIPRRILKGIKILPPGRKTRVYESVRDLPTSEFKFTLLYHLSIHHLPKVG